MCGAAGNPRFGRSGPCGLAGRHTGATRFTGDRPGTSGMARTTHAHAATDSASARGGQARAAQMSIPPTLQPPTPQPPSQVQMVVPTIGPTPTLTSVATGARRGANGAFVRRTAQRRRRDDCGSDRSGSRFRQRGRAGWDTELPHPGTVVQDDGLDERDVVADDGPFEIAAISPTPVSPSVAPVPLPAPRRVVVSGPQPAPTPLAPPAQAAAPPPSAASAPTRQSVTRPPARDGKPDNNKHDKPPKTNKGR